MNFIEKIRRTECGILSMGNQPGITQSIIDFDYLSGKKEPSVVACVTGNRTAAKFFWGKEEFLLACVPGLSELTPNQRKRIHFLLNLQSGRRALDSTRAFFNAFPNAFGAHIFAEQVPERHATELIRAYPKKYIFGPSGVGFLVSRHLKLGAIGGVDLVQIEKNKLAEEGSIAVVSPSGGMTNELIHAVAKSGKGLSFAISIGGERFPITSLTQAFKLAQADSQTKAVVYVGELGGTDEYDLVELMRTGGYTKPLVAYIAGTIDDAFSDHVQFGHAKALVSAPEESAAAKREALKKAGAIVPDTFPKFLAAFSKLPGNAKHGKTITTEPLMNRQKSILSTREIVDQEHVPILVKGKKLASGSEGSFVRAVLTALTGREPKSKITTAFTEAVFTLTIDHGGEVSGAVNTMITARAGKDLVASLAAGLLTIGPRFGGAVSGAAQHWLTAVNDGIDPHEFVEREAKAKRPIMGIGHAKYRVGVPDPRVAALRPFATLLKKHPHYDFACAVEKITTAKNGKLILNLDGTIAALMLDVLAECEKFSPEMLQELVQTEFFNALFIIPRLVGFSAHFMEQKKNDEGLFRLPEELLFTRKPKKGH